MFMMGIYTHNQVVLSANVFFPYTRRVWGMASYDVGPFMRFIPRDRNTRDIPYGENGHYSTTINTIHTYYEIRADFDELPWLKLKEHQRNFFMVCLYYGFMSFAAKHLKLESIRLRIGIDQTRIHILEQIKKLNDQDQLLQKLILEHSLRQIKIQLILYKKISNYLYIIKLMKNTTIILMILLH